MNYLKTVCQVTIMTETKNPIAASGTTSRDFDFQEFDDRYFQSNVPVNLTVAHIIELDNDIK